ncbi:hypothetical protein Cob_v008004 [Colletotrichum orbiculare MAFF 240422]|uniref:Uncharacterized protein n=1 Tax=Colletotrichum orbiculare (strain 104-T / ATCC 96160 / CBS 514.97 / LARS 414 / MAFF 240422) TaxID=1213857 RepID=A0A484FMT1_COLOR|nr:hypothetical protein Cob_v008004 [Colletotrichum orbiculare MAFF 240422]
MAHLPDTNRQRSQARGAIEARLAQSVGSNCTTSLVSKVAGLLESHLFVSLCCLFGPPYAIYPEPITEASTVTWLD